MPGQPADKAVAPQGDEVALAWAEDSLESRRYRSTLWPTVPGWHTLVWGAGSYAFHVSRADEWQAWQERQAHSATALRTALGDQGHAATSSEAVPRPLPRWPLFVALLTGWGAMLWADEQWRAQPARA